MPELYNQAIVTIGGGGVGNSHEQTLYGGLNKVRRVYLNKINQPCLIETKGMDTKYRD